MDVRSRDSSNQIDGYVMCNAFETLSIDRDDSIARMDATVAGGGATWCHRLDEDAEVTVAGILGANDRNANAFGRTFAECHNDDLTIGSATW